MKQGMHLSDLDTTAIILLASTTYNGRVEYTRPSEDVYMFELAC